MNLTWYHVRLSSPPESVAGESGSGPESEPDSEPELESEVEAEVDVGSAAEAGIRWQVKPGSGEDE